VTKIRFKLPEPGILLWIGAVSILAWGLVCLLYPGAAIVFVLGNPLGKLALELSDPSLSRKQERVTCKEDKGEKPWKESRIKTAESRWAC